MEQTRKVTRFVVSSTSSMSDEKINISILDLNPYQHITIHSFTVDDGSTFECIAHYCADAQGCIDLTTQGSIGGMYLGVEPMGLFWAMKPSPSNKTPHARLFKQDISTPLIVELKAYNTIIATLEDLHNAEKNNLCNTELAAIKLDRWFIAKGTEEVSFTMEQHGFHGTMFIPPGKGPYPGIIYLYGWHPGTTKFQSALLSSHGFVTLALALVGVPGMPLPSDTPWMIDLECYERAIAMLIHHPKVIKKIGIGIVSFSISTTIALRITEFLDHVKCVVCINGLTALTTPGIKYKNLSILPINTLPLLQASGEPPHGYVVGRNVFIKQDYFTSLSQYGLNHPHVIKFVNKRDVSFLFICGQSDQEVVSEFFLNYAEKLLKQGKHSNFKVLRYPGAGHGIEPPYGLHCKVVGTQKHGYRDWGGVTVSHCKAQENSWAEQLLFLKSNLCDPILSKL